MMKARPDILTFKEIFLFSILSFAVLVSPLSLAEEKPAAGAKPGMSQDEMMKAWIAYGTPGAEHKTLEAMAGSWDVSTKMWMAPGAPPQEVSGTSENKMILGGRYLEHTTKVR